MKAAILKGFGSSTLLDIQDIKIPEFAKDEVLVKLSATSINPVDWQTRNAFSVFPELIRRKPIILGHDLSGVITKVGADVKGFKAGDSVFGTNGLALDSISSRHIKTGTYCEYSAVKSDKVCHMPKNLTFSQAATLPLVALTAYQGLTKAHLKRGDKVLVIGGSGGVGSMAVQIAKAMGAKVTTVCSTRNISLVRELGADDVIDYTSEDYLNSDHNFDIVFNTIGQQTYSTCSNLLSRSGTFIDCAAPSLQGAVGLLKRYLSFSSHKNIFFLYHSSKKDLVAISRLIENGQLMPVIAKEISLRDINQGLELSQTGRVAGKISVLIE